jgi:4'-phosphopantetheinyl transferase
MSATLSESFGNLRPGLLYLWTMSTDDSAATTACSLQAILSGDEQREALRFRRAKDQHQFVLAHALVRLALSRCFPVPAGEWCFGRDRDRKPFIASPKVSPAAQFSLSHTEGLIACLITLSTEAAVDVEKVEHNQDLPLVARQVLSAAELRTLSNLSGRDWTAQFFDYWTLKEAYAKARGLGLGLKLSGISIELGLDNAIRAHFASSIDDDSSSWVFWRRRLPSKHTLSVAVRHDFFCEPRVIWRSVRFEGMRMTESSEVLLSCPD